MREDPLRSPPPPATFAFLLAHPLHAIALGLGSGLAPWAPGTAGTLFAWLVFAAVQPRQGLFEGAALLTAGFGVGCWASTVTARHLGQGDPGCIVIDEVIAFWLVLWLLMPAGPWAQAAAFALFRFFDAVKPGPVAWADARFKPARPVPGSEPAPIGWTQGLGIMLDDLVAALCTLLVIGLWRLALA